MRLWCIEVGVKIPKKKKKIFFQKIDFAWIDIEGGEFEFLEKIHNDVQFCQFNIEVHSRFAPAGAQVFHDFIFRVLEEQKYVFLQSMHTGGGVHRMFFLNVQDKECLAKYFNNYWFFLGFFWIKIFWYHIWFFFNLTTKKFFWQK